MEERTRPTGGSMPRGVSTTWDCNADLAGRSIDPLDPGRGQSLYRTETALPDPSLIPRITSHDTNSVGSRRERFNLAQSAQPAHWQQTPTFEHASRGMASPMYDSYMTDDVHVHYNTYAPSSSTHTMTGGQTNYEGLQGSSSKPLPPQNAGQHDTGAVNFADQFRNGNLSMAYSSSYPSNSPFLPPPPPTYPSFDPAMVMFPGSGAVDGGIRTVPPHSHGDIPRYSTDDNFTTTAGCGEDDWKRHTRVYGGGVCLACAGRGGTYGATVRPEDRR
ncbi:hypothetical protein BD289DRAFT_247230 [Coniella lustricola]|uniref:Uncharacterized protein n=1 Tax=Coniella lustricola TaxID=2025994 RepID=A0A2T3A8R3_9PEZI|nr:hypothetical protein BD289DRAFT_247230 [Coniella lustricola]